MTANIERLTAAIQDAVIELVAAHSPRSDGRVCVTCGAEDGSWPCVSAMVADDLRVALQNGRGCSPEPGGTEQNIGEGS